MSGQQIWRGEYAIETSATADVIGTFFSRCPGLENLERRHRAHRDGGAVLGGNLAYDEPPGEDFLRSRLVEVIENECFVDETCVGDLAITVAHRIESVGGGRTRITYAAEAIGPDAAVIGPAVASDFPLVLANLANLAEGRSA